MKSIITRKDAITRGLNRFYTGKPCRKKHIAERAIFNGGCIECMKINRRKYGKTEKYKAKNQKYKKSKKGRKAQKNYRQSPKGIWYRKNVIAKSPKKKATDFKYRQSVKGILKRRERERGAKHMATKLKWRKTSVKGQKMMMWANLRSRLKKWTTSKNLGRRSKINELVGCSKDYLKKHIEKQFKSGMTWENHGRYGWHIDHIIPLKKFDPKDPNEVKKANHYSNLQPLWATENLKKNKY